MYWDTMDWFLDDEDTKRIKSYRRKSNYYEKKSNALETCYQNVKVKLDTISSYGLTRSGVSTDSNNVMKYRYYNAEKELLQGANQQIVYVEEQLVKLKNLVDDAKQLYEKYHRLAEGG